MHSRRFCSALTEAIGFAEDRAQQAPVGALQGSAQVALHEAQPLGPAGPVGGVGQGGQILDAPANRRTVGRPLDALAVEEPQPLLLVPKQVAEVEVFVPEACLVEEAGLGAEQAMAVAARVEVYLGGAALRRVTGLGVGLATSSGAAILRPAAAVSFSASGFLAPYLHVA